MRVTKPVKKSNKKPVIKKTQNISQTIEQTDDGIRNAFYNMEEGTDYVLNDFWFQEANRFRREYGNLLVKQKQDYSFSRKGNRLFINDSLDDSLVFDFDGKHNLTLAIACDLAFTFSFPFTCDLAFTLTLALKHNGFEKLNKNTCDGKVVEIDGKKYKLTAV
jgi:hypothetical protein